MRDIEVGDRVRYDNGSFSDTISPVVEVHDDHVVVDDRPFSGGSLRKVKRSAINRHIRAT